MVSDRMFTAGLDIALWLTQLQVVKEASGSTVGYGRSWQ